jgi:hypothetical protein
MEAVDPRCADHIAAASAFGWLLRHLRGPSSSQGDRRHGATIRAIMFLLVAVFTIVGDFIDRPAIIIFMPASSVTDQASINSVHMGIVLIITLAFGLITPPYGLSLLMASKFVGVRFDAALRASLPIYVIFFATIAFAIFFPKAVLWLPKTLFPESVGCFKAPDSGGYICPWALQSTMERRQVTSTSLRFRSASSSTQSANRIASLSPASACSAGCGQSLPTPFVPAPPSRRPWRPC